MTLDPHGSLVTPGLDEPCCAMCHFKVIGSNGYFGGSLQHHSLLQKSSSQNTLWASGFGSIVQQASGGAAATGSMLGIGRLLPNSVSKREGEQPGY